MTSVLFLGLMIGMQHALEADHIAAVASIAARETTLKRAVTHGAAWGLGHTLTLMAVAGGVVVLGTTIDAQIAAYLEAVVGVMLIGLGGHLLYRLWRDRIHFHVHRHTGGAAHFHAHSHKGEAQAHKKSSHDHTHPRRLPVRTVLVGMMHGLAGSAALLILTASTVDSPALGLIYIALFGIGSIAGMAALSAVIAVPMSYSARFVTWANRSLQAGVAVATAGLGIWIVIQSTPV
ncbi:MAG: urease accessory protein [Rhodospirillaceae bacterium]|jgi:ABC-type nickel/cobalt efflux system permease component RcnA|nr:urease accessory protein [Rhodospirillaceae bacterium]MBT6084897.1 urease accessory protein [Rhodospirillaceae bacterium]MBT7250808.1 urease accessory protein [Rhodospirillaceae bacterium]MBT7511571.1 urease accessory protein [Rhodospirillaceae bacterium]